MIKTKAKREHLVDCPETINIGLIIVSTSRFREIENKDTSTEENLPLMKEILSRPIHLDVNAHYNVVFDTIIPDQSKVINQILKKLLFEHRNLHVLIFSGGTGITKNDITIETLVPHFHKELPGFGELFRFLSYNEIGNSTILSRATAGVIDNTVVFLIPGSTNAVKIAMEQIIAPELPHILSEIYREIRKEEEGAKF